VASRASQDGSYSHSDQLERRLTTPPIHAQKFRVWITGQVRGATAPIRREMRHRAAVEPVIGHIKAEHRMGRNCLKGRDGDRINAVLAAAGYNFGLLLRWLERLLRALIRVLLAAPGSLETVQRMLLGGSSQTTN
jgi:hypothetical protein